MLAGRRYSTETTRTVPTVSLEREGAELVDSEPREGLFGLQVAFLHPDAVHGVLAEIVSDGR